MNDATNTTAQIATLRADIRELEHYVLSSPEGSAARRFHQRNLDWACAELARLDPDC